MDIFGTLKNVATLSKRVDDALEIKQAVEELQKTVSALVEQLQGLERLLAKFKGGKCD
jgi:ABC-type transporter Mla subunit MlaD